MLDALRMSLNAPAVLGFAVYILVAAALFALFQFIYTRVTPHKEFALIREGNSAAAVALGGSWWASPCQPATSSPTASACWTSWSGW